MNILALSVVLTLMVILTWLNLAGTLFLTLTVMLCLLVLLGKVLLLEVERHGIDRARDVWRARGVAEGNTVTLVWLIRLLLMLSLISF